MSVATIPPETRSATELARSRSSAALLDGLVAPARVELRLTAAGRAALPFAAIALLVGFALGGTAALLGSTALALFALSPLFAWLSLRGLRIGPPAPRAVFAMEDVVLELQAANASRSFRARDVVLHCGGDARRAALPAGHCSELGPHERATLRIGARLSERGRHTLLPIGASTAHPFGLVRCVLAFPLAVDLLALPSVGSLGPLALRAARDAERASEAPPRRRGEEETYGVREWRPGESLRRMHWKLSARRGRGIVRELHAAADPPLFLALATAIDAPAEAGPRKRAFETAVSLTATLAEHHLRRGRRVLLALGDGETTSALELSGRRGLWRALARLAEVEARAGDARAAAQRLFADERAFERQCLVVCAGGGGGARAKPARAPGTRGVLLDVDDPRIELFFQRGRVFRAHATAGEGSDA